MDNLHVINLMNLIIYIVDNINLLSDLQSKIELIQIELKYPDKCYIGQIDLVKEHSFKARLLSPKANWLLIEVVSH